MAAKGGARKAGRFVRPKGSEARSPSTTRESAPAPPASPALARMRATKARLWELREQHAARRIERAKRRAEVMQWRDERLRKAAEAPPPPARARGGKPTISRKPGVVMASRWVRKDERGRPVEGRVPMPTTARLGRLAITKDSPSSVLEAKTGKAIGVFKNRAQAETFMRGAHTGRTLDRALGDVTDVDRQGLPWSREARRAQRAIQRYARMVWGR